MTVKPSEILLRKIAEESPKPTNPRSAAVLFCVQTMNDLIYVSPYWVIWALGPFSETGLLTRASTNVHNYDEILLTKQNCVTEQHISMVFFLFQHGSLVMGLGHTDC